MITRCPNCGSTAQVKRELAVPSESVDKEVVSIHYTCGCGCHFAEQYRYSNTILKWNDKRGKK
jgi:hypothetical protein